MNRIEHTRAWAFRRAPSGRWAGETARRRCIFGSMLAATALMFAVPVGTAVASVPTSLEQWQLRRLNEPSERERTHEREGHVYIYDGLTDREVDQALSAHFKRIEYMMFVGTRKTGSTDAANSMLQGEAEKESSGCGGE